MAQGRRGGADSYRVLSGSVGNDPTMLGGTVDPSAGGGVVAKEGSIYMRYGAGAGQAWYKSGAADTAWTQIGSSSQPDIELWIPANPGDGDYTFVDDNEAAYASLSQYSMTTFTFIVPLNFSSLTSMKVLVEPRDSEAAWNIRLGSRFCAEGEHRDGGTTDTDITQTYNLTLSDLEWIDVSSVCTAIAAGDLGTIRVSNYHANVELLNVIGLRMVYSV